MLYLLKPVKLNEHAYITLHHIWANVSKNVVILDVRVLIRFSAMLCSSSFLIAYITK